MFLSCRPFVTITTFSTGLVGVEVTSVSWLGETEVTSTPTRPVENVVITTNGLQDRNIHILDGTTVKNKDKLILTGHSLIKTEGTILKEDLHWNPQGLGEEDI